MADSTKDKKKKEEKKKKRERNQKVNQSPSLLKLFKQK